MKSKIRIPLQQYAFVELEVEDKTLEEINDIAEEMTRISSFKEGIEDKEWREALDNYLTTNELDSGIYESMNINQKMVIQEVKKATKRLTSKEQ